MREITRVAKEGERLIIICSIHQPSTKVYSGFDQLMILSKGREAFVGNADAASAYYTNAMHTYIDKQNEHASQPLKLLPITHFFPEQWCSHPPDRPTCSSSS
jgi:ABC-type multidrug transport system ATPase subunit